MFNIFGKTSGKAERRALMERAESLSDRLSDMHMYRAGRSMDDVRAQLDKSGNGLNKKRTALINECLSYIESHAEPGYEQIISAKIAQMQDIINGKTDTAQTSADLQNEAEIARIETEISKIDKSLSDIENEQQKYLGTNKSKWMSLESQKKRLKYTKASLEQNFSMILTHQENMSASENLAAASKFAAQIDSQLSAVDTESAKEHAEARALTAQDITDMQSELAKITDSESVSLGNAYEYDRAYEEMLLKSNASEKDISDREKSKTEG